MKLKYYLRGAGIGFIVSAILFACFLTALDWGPRQGNVSKQEAQVDEPFMGDTVKEAEEKIKEEVKTGEVEVENAVESKSEAVSSEKKEEKPEVKVPTTTKTDEDVKPENQTDPEKKLTKNVHFSIKDGEASNAIANNLQSLGLVDDAKAFDQFLSENGYDHKLRTGEFEIETGMDYKDLAELLCKKQ